MNVFENSVRYSGNVEGCSKREWIGKIKGYAIESLIEIHDMYSLFLSQTIDIDTSSVDPEKSKRIEANGQKYAKDIIKYYQSFDVFIGILPDAECRDDRYIFPVKLMPGTTEASVSSHTDNVRRLLGIGFLFPDITPSTIRLIASEKPLKENSLMKILQSPEFQESKMKIPYAVGYGLMGEMVIEDVDEFPHLLIGGASKSGKSSAIHSLLMSIVYKQPAEKVKLLLLDYGSSRLKMFKYVPHMLLPGRIVSDIAAGRRCMLKLQEITQQRLGLV